MNDLERERAGANRLLAEVGPERFQCGWADDPAGEDGEVAGEERRRRRHREGDFEIAGDGNGGDVGVEDARVEHVFLVERVLRIELAQDVGLDRGCVNRRAIMKSHAGPEGERVREQILGRRPRFGQGAFDLDRAGLEAGESFGQVVVDGDDVAVAVRPGDGGIELDRRLGDRDHERLAAILERYRAGVLATGGEHRPRERRGDAESGRTRDKSATGEPGRLEVGDQAFRVGCGNWRKPRHIVTLQSGQGLPCPVSRTRS